MNKDVVLLGNSFSDVYNNLFKDDFSNFEAFLMLAVHRRSDSNTNRAWYERASILILWIAEKNDYGNLAYKENRKTHLLRDMKRVNGVLAMLFWWLIEKPRAATFHTFIARLYKTPESGNGTKMSDEKWRSANSRYLENKKW